MGCIESVPKKRMSIEESYIGRLVESIESESDFKLCKIKELIQKIHSNNPSIFDENLISIKSIKLSPLSYSVVKGKAQSFKLLLSSGCSFSKMIKNFDDYKVKPLDLILSKGYVNLFHAFFNEYLKIRTNLIEEDSNPSSPIQAATRKGMLDIINYIYSKHIIDQYPEFDLSSTDSNGENCALIACREGNLSLIEFFHVTCKLDFHLINNFKQNAIMICLIGFKEKNLYNYGKCVNYLVEKVGVDFCYNYEEMMSLAEGDIYEDLNKILSNVGVYVDKSKLKAKDYAYVQIINNENFEIMCGEENPSICNSYLINSLRSHRSK